MKVFVDTGAFCAFTIPNDQHNRIAKEIYKRLKGENAAFYTSNYVLDEVFTLLKTRGSHKTAVKFMEQLEEKSHLDIMQVSEVIEEAAKVIFKRFDDKRLSFTDCTSFSLINRFKIDAVFAFDEHFRYHPYSHTVTFLGQSK